MVLPVNCGEDMRNHCILHFKWVKCVVCALYLNKAVIKVKAERIYKTKRALGEIAIQASLRGESQGTEPESPGVAVALPRHPRQLPPGPELGNQAQMCFL